MLSWKAKKPIIFLFSIIGSLAKAEFWQDVKNEVPGVNENFLQKAEEVVKVTEELSLMLDIENEEFDRMAKDIKKKLYTVEVFHDIERQEASKRNAKTQIKINKGYFDELVGMVCVNCEDCIRNIKKCHQRKLFKKMGIEAYDPERTESGCEYWYSRK